MRQPLLHKKIKTLLIMTDNNDRINLINFMPDQEVSSVSLIRKAVSVLLTLTIALCVITAVPVHISAAETMRTVMLYCVGSNLESSDKLATQTLIEAMEIYKPSQHVTGWADDINIDTTERVINVMQNVVRGIRDKRQKERVTE